MHREWRRMAEKGKKKWQNLILRQLLDGPVTVAKLKEQGVPKRSSHRQLSTLYKFKLVDKEKRGLYILRGYPQGIDVEPPLGCCITVP
jgi:DNA-binding HxlR family transcriptional regulator